MPNAWSVDTTATFVAAVIGALVSAVAVAVTVVEGQATRRRAAADAHRDQWWERWSWIAERALAEHPVGQQAALLLLRSITERPWCTSDDRAIAAAIALATEDGQDDAQTE